MTFSRKRVTLADSETVSGVVGEFAQRAWTCYTYELARYSTIFFNV
jgi:hypothetical protein